MSDRIGGSKSPSIVDLIICPLEKFVLMVFVDGHRLFRLADSAMKFPVHTKPATA